ncbi:hypothetical protein ACFPPD_09335 [Cohnella suwonensis]|uniref:Uncharacterized protein n=1 Tax=Cohnella suwonensis TaxID=696072 RepID=A0ABW0LUH0_9BACL
MHEWPRELLAFKERSVPVYIHLAAANPGQPPFCCRGYGYHLELAPGAGRMWISVLKSQWVRLNAYLAANPADRSRSSELTALLTAGTDNRSYQFKGPFIEFRMPAKEDAASIEEQRRLTARYSPHLAPLVNVAVSDCLAIGFRIGAVYEQTPGPNAGELVSERRGES